MINAHENESDLWSDYLRDSDVGAIKMAGNNEAEKPNSLHPKAVISKAIWTD